MSVLWEEERRMLEHEAEAVPRSPSSLELWLSRQLLLLQQPRTEVGNRHLKVLARVWPESPIRISGTCFLARSDVVKAWSLVIYEYEWNDDTNLMCNLWKILPMKTQSVTKLSELRKVTHLMNHKCVTKKIKVRTNLQRRNFSSLLFRFFTQLLLYYDKNIVLFW